MPYYIKSEYQQKENTVEHQRFSQEYFSGSDVNIYFGDIWLDEITALQISVQENVQPIYGYASYTSDAWARGTRLVTGSFRINFKESNYINAVLNLIEKRKESHKDFPQSQESLLKPPKNIEDALDELERSADSQAFNKLAKAYQRAIWGEDTHSRVENQENDSYFYPNSINPKLRKEGFSILINYGPSIEETYRQLRSGKPEDVNATVKSIVGVQLSAVTQVIDGSGQPIEEEYTFIAKDLDYKIR